MILRHGWVKEDHLTIYLHEKEGGCDLGPEPQADIGQSNPHHSETRPYRRIKITL